MGYRFQSRMAEEQPVFAPQGADPNVFLAARQRASQQAMQQAQQAQQMDQQTNEINLNATKDFWNNAAGAVDKGIGAYRDAKREGRDERKFESDQRMTEEEYAGLKGRNTREEKFGDRREEATIKNMDATADVNVAGAEEAKAKTAFANATNSTTGESNRTTGFKSDLGKTLTEGKIATAQLGNEAKRLELAEQELIERKDLAPLKKKEMLASINAQYASAANQRQQSKVAQLGIDETERSNRVRAATARLYAPRAGESQEAIIRELEASGAKPAEIAEAIGGVKDKNQQQKLLAYLQDPMLQRTTAKINEGYDELDASRTAIAEIDNAAAQYADTNAVFDDGAMESSVSRLKQVANYYGLSAQANDLDKMYKLDAIGRTDRINKLAAAVKSAAASRVGSYRSYNPAFGQAANEIEKSTLTGSGKNGPENKTLAGLLGSRDNLMNFAAPGMQNAFPNRGPMVGQPGAQFINNQPPPPAGAQPAAPMPLPPLDPAFKPRPKVTTTARR